MFYNYATFCRDSELEAEYLLPDNDQQAYMNQIEAQPSGDKPQPSGDEPQPSGDEPEPSYMNQGETQPTYINSPPMSEPETESQTYENSQPIKRDPKVSDIRNVTIT